jgi:hypothetical protein
VRDSVGRGEDGPARVLAYLPWELVEKRLPDRATGIASVVGEVDFRIIRPRLTAVI